MKGMIMEKAELHPEIGLLIQDGLDASFETEFRNIVKIDDERLTIERHSGGPYAGLALYLPTAIMIFVASSYFGGIFKKIGEEHYLGIKSASIALWKKAKILKISAVGPHQKIADYDRYQLSYSIVAGVNEKIRFKLILKMELTEDESVEAISGFLDLIRRLHLNQLIDIEREKLIYLRPVGGTVVVTYDPVNRSIIGAD
jgi:hypothetical protein